MPRVLLLLLGMAASAAAISAPQHSLPMAGRRLAFASENLNIFSAKKFEPKPPAFLKGAYAAAGAATTATWVNIVRTTIRSNQPVGAMMPSVQHQIFGRTSVLSAVPLILTAYGILASASDSWESLRSDTCRRLNLALATAGVGGALWVRFAPLLTQLPDTAVLANPLSHASYKGLPRAAMIASYGSAAALSAAVWARSLPEDVRKNPLSWPGRIADGLCKSLVTLGPANSDNPTNVKYSVLATSFLFLTALQLGTFPGAVVPSWTGRRLSRHYPAWTLLAAASAFNLKEATESGKLFSDETQRTLSRGLAGMGAVYLTAKFGSVFLDPSWPGHYKLVTQRPFLQGVAALMFGLTLRPDGQPSKQAAPPPAFVPAPTPAAPAKKESCGLKLPPVGQMAGSVMCGLALGHLTSKKD